MLDVHPPHAPTHTWRDFFIHIATICVGLLIAIGLEQSVEAIHHQHERKELREAMDRDAEKAIADCTQAETGGAKQLLWLDERMHQVREAIDQRKPLTVIRPQPATEINLIEEPAWRAATSSGLLSMLPQSDIKAYDKVSRMIEDAAKHYWLHYDAEAARIAFENRFRSAPDAPPDFSNATPDDLKEYLSLLSKNHFLQEAFEAKIRGVRGAETSVLHGARNLNQIERDERQFGPLPS